MSDHLSDVPAYQVTLSAPRPSWDTAALTVLWQGQLADIVSRDSQEWQDFHTLVADMDRRAELGLRPLMQPPGAVWGQGTDGQPCLRIVWGHRRTVAMFYRAARDGLSPMEWSLPVFIEETTDEVQVVAARLAENRERSSRPYRTEAEDLDLVRTLLEIQRLQEALELTPQPLPTSLENARLLRDALRETAKAQEADIPPERLVPWREVERLLGLSNTTRKRLSLFLLLPPEVQARFPLSAGYPHTRALMRLNSHPVEQRLLLDEILQERLGGQQALARARRLLPDGAENEEEGEQLMERDLPWQEDEDWALQVDHRDEAGEEEPLADPTSRADRYDEPEGEEPLADPAWHADHYDAPEDDKSSRETLSQLDKGNDVEPQELASAAGQHTDEANDQADAEVANDLPIPSEPTELTFAELWALWLDRAYHEMEMVDPAVLPSLADRTLNVLAQAGMIEMA
jgi:hypothetical protein